jgi:hypothetical protein
MRDKATLRVLLAESGPYQRELERRRIVNARLAMSALRRAAVPSPVTRGRITGWSYLVTNLRQASGVDFTLHDLRRTCRTLMSRLGVDEDIAELAIGHVRDEPHRSLQQGRGLGGPHRCLRARVRPHRGPDRRGGGSRGDPAAGLRRDEAPEINPVASASRMSVWFAS